MRYLSQTKAAKLAGVSRGTIANRIEDGVLSCSPEGIDPADLVRVFPNIDGALVDRFLSTGEVSGNRSEAPPTPANSPANDRSSPMTVSAGEASAVTVAIADEVAWLRGLVDEQRATLARKDHELAAAAERLHEAEERAERREATWLKQLDALTTKLLPAPEPVAAEPAASPGLLRRLFG